MSSATSSPTVLPTYMPTLADAEPSTLVLGMGAGTLTMIVLSVALAIVWILSMTCSLGTKSLWRIVSTSIYAAVFLLLVFSPREDEFDTSSDDLTQIYDYSIVPRIAISAVSVLFGFVAAAILLLHLGEKKQLSTAQQDLSAFWADE